MSYKDETTKAINFIDFYERNMQKHLCHEYYKLKILRDGYVSFTDNISSRYQYIDHYVMQFYILDILNQKTMMKINSISGEKLYNKVNDYYMDYCKEFARYLYEYLILSSVLEATYSRDRRLFLKTEDKIYKLFYDINDANMYSGRNVIRNLLFCNRIDLYDDKLLDFLARLFDNDSNWSKNRRYGGKPWKEIVENAKKYKSLQDVVFIDMVIDMEHNSGCVLNKNIPFLLKPSELDTFLHEKTYGNFSSILNCVENLFTKLDFNTVSFIKKYFNVIGRDGIYDDSLYLEDKIFYANITTFAEMLNVFKLSGETQIIIK